MNRTFRSNNTWYVTIVVVGDLLERELLHRVGIPNKRSVGNSNMESTLPAQSGVNLLTAC